jgi:hypothetical protein
MPRTATGAVLLVHVGDPSSNQATTLESHKAVRVVELDPTSVAAVAKKIVEVLTPALRAIFGRG